VCQLSCCGILISQNSANGTRLAVKKLLNNVVEATILTGPFKGEDVLIPQILMIPTDTPFQFKRLQFPMRLAFAVTIIKLKVNPWNCVV
jgi:PIF1 helicase.